MGTATAIIAAAAIGAGASVYQSNEQQRIAEEQQRRREEAAKNAKAEADRIAADTRPEGESAKAVKFGVDNGSKDTSSVQDFLVPRTSALGTSSSGRSGLGFAV